MNLSTSKTRLTIRSPGLKSNLLYEPAKIQFEAVQTLYDKQRPPQPLKTSPKPSQQPKTMTHEGLRSVATIIP
jgi:hypothetical protein